MARRKNPERLMTLTGHLREFRKRLSWSAGFLLLASVAGWFLFEIVFEILQQPIFEVAQQRGVTAVVNFGTVVSPFDLRIQVSLFLGTIISSPFWLYNLWAFITPGLKKRERRFALGFVFAALPLFLGGTLLAWYSLPRFVVALIAFTPEGSSNVINASDYILFTIRILLVFGIAFVMPVLLVMLNFAGLVTSKGILKSWRMAVFVIAVVSALATPAAEPISMFLLMLPLSLMFFGAVGIAWLNDKRVARRQSKVFEDAIVPTESE